MYLLFKSLHIISFVAWLAGLLYLPRVLEYQADERVNSRPYNKFIKMEYRLLKFIIDPAMIFIGYSDYFLYLMILIPWFLLYGSH